MRMRSVALAIVFASVPAAAFCFAPRTSVAITIRETIATSPSALSAGSGGTVKDGSTAAAGAGTTTTSTSRRQLIQQSVVSAFLSTAIKPTFAYASDTSFDNFNSIEKSTNALSDSLGHAIIVIDGLNAQAARLGSSPHPAHPIAVLDGMHAQARRLTRDISQSRNVLETIQNQAKEITRADESVSNKVSHAASVLDGILAQSLRLEGASSWGGSEAVVTAADGRGSSSSSSSSTDDQIIYMLSVLDGLNAQVKRLNVQDTLSALDVINSRAAQALL